MTAPHNPPALKPCPDGHKTVQVAQWPNGAGKWRYYGFCTCCGWRSGGNKTEAEAVTAWNTRTTAQADSATAPLEARIAALEGALGEAVGALEYIAEAEDLYEPCGWAVSKARTTLASVSAMLEGGST
jgi:hypothetical protein